MEHFGDVTQAEGVETLGGGGKQFCLQLHQDIYGHFHQNAGQSVAFEKGRVLFQESVQNLKIDRFYGLRIQVFKLQDREISDEFFVELV